MSTIAEIRDRLRVPGTPFTAVMGATQLALAKDRPDATLPVAYVLAVKEASTANSRVTGPVLQRSERDVMVVIVAEDLGDPLGEATTDALETLKAWVRRQLIGFMPTDMNEKITHVGGEVVQAVAACVWFEDTFSAPIYLTET